MINLHHYRTRSGQQPPQQQLQRVELSVWVTLFFVFCSPILKLAAAVSAEAVPMGRTTKHPALLLVSLKKRRAPIARGNSAAAVAVDAAAAAAKAAICFYFMRRALKNAVNVSDAGLQTAQTGTCRLGECPTAPKRQTARQPSHTFTATAIATITTTERATQVDSQATKQNGSRS